MFLKSLVILSVLKLTVGSLECGESTVTVDTLKEQCPYHEHNGEESEHKNIGSEQHRQSTGPKTLIHDKREKLTLKNIFTSVSENRGYLENEGKNAKEHTLDKGKEKESGEGEELDEFKSETKIGREKDDKVVSGSEETFLKDIELKITNETETIKTSENYDISDSYMESEEKCIEENSNDSATDLIKNYNDDDFLAEHTDVKEHVEDLESVTSSENGTLSESDTKLPATTARTLGDSPQFSRRISHYELDNEAQCVDCDLSLLPVQPSDHQQPKLDEKSTSLSAPTIQFSELPEGDKFLIESFRLTEGFFVFSYLREFISYIQPNEFPVGLLQGALQNQISLVSLIAESLQVEAGFVAVLVVGIILALAVPCVILSHTCYRMRNSKKTKRPAESAESAENEDIVIGWAGNCRRRTLVFILQLLLLLLIAGMLAMFVTNEQMSSAMDQSSKVLLTALGDVRTFLHNSHLQLHFIMTRSLDQAIQACYADLDNIGVLLGRPIQEELISETGLDVTLASLDEVSDETTSAAKQVDDIMANARALQDVLISSRDRLAELRHQVDMFRRQCPPRDRALCDTINPSGLDVILRLDRIRGDERLNRIRQLGGSDLMTTVQDARNHFDSVPRNVEGDTRDTRQVVRRQLARQRSTLDDGVRTLEQFTRNVGNKIGDASRLLADWLHDLEEVEFWRWIVSGSAAVSVLSIWILLLCGISCGCCGSEKSVGPTLLGSIVLICLVSTALWAIALLGFLIGGHGQVFLCRPLYDEPHYSALSRLLDEPGVFYRDSKHGFFSHVMYGNDSIDVSVKDILRDCQENKPAYQTFHLQRVFDVDSASDFSKWEGVRNSLHEIQVDLSHVQLLTPALNNQLDDLLEGLSVNFTSHRAQLSGSVTGKDLHSFAIQLDSVANQIRDPATSARMEALAARTRRLITTDIQPLEEKKDALIYQLTSLEVQVIPLERRVNQSLSQLKTIQFYINSQGGEIANKKTKEYVERLNSYIQQFREHVLEMARGKVAPCKPIWTVFHSTRLLLCKHIVDPLNGYWFATMWCLVVFLVATPVCLKLVDYYRLKGSCNTRSSGSPSECLMIAEHGRGWSTPGEGGDANSW